MTPRVSVIVPAYNPGPYLRQCLESVIAQTFTQWECVVVDDGSTEDLSWVRSTDSRIRLLRKENGGVSSARNFGIWRTDAALISLLDADDWWASTFLEKSIAAMIANPRAGMCNTQDQYANPDGELMSRGQSREVSGYPDLLRSNNITTSSTTIRRSTLLDLGGFDESLTHGEDYHLWLRIAEKYPIAHVPSIETFYRHTPGSASQNAYLMGKSVTKVLKAHIHNAKKTGDDEAWLAASNSLAGIKAGWGAAAFDQARVAWSCRDYSAVARHLLEAARLSPKYTGRQLSRWINPLLRLGKGEAT
jgi:glycosyltransferase involved in cell wall biosynthesis